MLENIYNFNFRKSILQSHPFAIYLVLYPKQQQQHQQQQKQKQQP